MSGLIDPLSFLLFACPHSSLPLIEHDVPASPVIRLEQFEGGTIMGHCLLGSGVFQCLCSSTERVVYPSRPVTTACEVEGKIGELVHAHGMLMAIVSFKCMANEFMKTTTARGAHLGVEALTNFVVGEEKASLLISSNEPCSCCF